MFTYFGASPPLSHLFLLEEFLAGIEYIHNVSWIQLYHSVLVICDVQSYQSGWFSVCVFSDRDRSEVSPAAKAFDVISAKLFSYWPVMCWQIVRHCERVGLASYFPTSFARIWPFVAVCQEQVSCHSLTGFSLASYSMGLEMFQAMSWIWCLMDLCCFDHTCEVEETGEGLERGQIGWVIRQNLEVLCDYGCISFS